MNKTPVALVLLAASLATGGLSASSVMFCRFEARVVSFDEKTRELTFRPTRLLETKGPRNFCDVWRKSDVKYTLKSGSPVYRPDQQLKAEYTQVYNMYRGDDGKVVRKRQTGWSFSPGKERPLPFLYLDR